ncbi:MAG: hypothetical protein EBW44_13745 [Rhodobacteraceae bacterium]|nr:hypothetical protein [Paracoccaceae bacterium]
MPYARINMAEFKTRDEMIKTLAVLKNDIKSVFPEIGAFTAIETGETSILTISVYDDEAAGPLGGNQNISRNSFTLTFVIALKAFDEFGHLCVRVSV